MRWLETHQPPTPTALEDETASSMNPNTSATANLAKDSLGSTLFWLFRIDETPAKHKIRAIKPRARTSAFPP